MKCDLCQHKKYKPAGSFLSVAEGNDDPHSYEYCAKDQWIGSCCEPQSQHDFEASQLNPDKDFWVNCELFEESQPKPITQE